MSTAADKGPHPATEELDLLAAAEDPAHPAEDRQTAHTAAHVLGCAGCAEQVAALRRVRALLRHEAAHPGPVPAAVARRVAAALAREAARRTGTPEPGSGTTPAATPAAGPGTTTVLPQHRATRRGQRPPGGSRVPRWLAAAAGLVVLGGTALAASDLLGPRADEASVAGQAEQAADHGATGLESGDPAAGAAPPVPVVATGTGYEPEDLAGQVAELLAAVERDAERPGTADERPPPPATARSGPAQPTPGRVLGDGSPLARRDALAACLDALGVPGAAPRAVDLADWQGRAAAVIVLPPQQDADAGRLQVWVVGPGCGTRGDDLLHFARVTP